MFPWDKKLSIIFVFKCAEESWASTPFSLSTANWLRWHQTIWIGIFGEPCPSGRSGLVTTQMCPWYSGACIYDLCIRKACMTLMHVQYTWIIETPQCTYDACIYDPWSWCMNVWCMYVWCMYTSMIHNPWPWCMYLWCDWNLESWMYAHCFTISRVGWDMNLKPAFSFIEKGPFACRTSISHHNKSAILPRLSLQLWVHSVHVWQGACVQGAYIEVAAFSGYRTPLLWTPSSPFWDGSGSGLQLWEAEITVFFLLKDWVVGREMGGRAIWVAQCWPTSETNPSFYSDSKT